MTPIQFRGCPKNGLDDCIVTVFMYNNTFGYKFVFEHSERIPVSMPLTIWTPQAITDPNHNTLETNT